MFGSLILSTGGGGGGGGGAGTRITRIRTGGGGGGINHDPSPRDNLSSIPYHHPTMYFLPPSSRKLPRTRIRASSADTLPRVELSKPTTTTTTLLNLYQILRIKQNASSLEIKTAYRKLAKQFHPDALTTASKSSSSSDSGGCGRDFMAIHNAYATLSDPTQRARYDLSIQIQSSSSSTHTRRFHRYYSSSSSSAVDGNENRSYGGMQTRRWETDQCW